jgi:4-carboxymuconolactone decarboxylase
MPDSQAMTPAQKAIGDFAPKLVSLTDDVLFGDVWNARSCPSETAA